MKQVLKKILLVIVVLGSILYWHNGQKKVAQTFNCIGEKASNFDCYRTYYSNLVKNQGIKETFKDLKLRYEKDRYVTSQCHQIVHVIGFAASEQSKDVTDAYTKGDSFCWSGYYHGVLEQVVSEIGYENLVDEINNICKPLAEKSPYSFNHYNCAHGLGHGIMAIEDDELFKSLENCNNLKDSWERSSCWGGVFMENIMGDVRYHTSKYLKPKDPLYPCNAVDDRYKNACYLMQTSYMLTVAGGNFEKVFGLCSTIEKSYQNICYQSLGRDVSGRSISNVTQTKEWCYLGKEAIQRENCIVGAVKDFIGYFHSDVQAKELCMALEEKSVQDICYNTTKSFYKTF